MQQLILILHVLVAIAIIALVLLQHGRGADVGAAFGSGSSNTMFGSQGAMPFLMKVTVCLSILFFATNLTLGYFTGHTAVQLTQTMQTHVKQSGQSEIVFPSTKQ